MFQSEQALFGVSSDPEQRLKLARVQAFMAAAEGFGDHVTEVLERKLLGHRPAYDVGAMGRRLFGSRRAGVVLRWMYGPTLAIVQKKLRLPPLLFGPVIALCELVAMPRVGATPLVRK